MQIRNKLTLQFTGIVALILLVFCVAVYNLSARYTSYQFEERLKEKALNTAQLLLEVEEIDEGLLKSIRRKYLQTLYQEFVRIYDKNNDPIFQDDVYTVDIDEEDLNYIRYHGELGINLNNRQIYGVSYIDRQKEFVVIASAVDRYGITKIKNLKLLLIFGYIVSLIIIYIGGKLFSFAALRPIAKVVDQVEKVDASTLDTKLDEGKGKDEVEKLAVTFNKMFLRLKKAFDLQKMFVSGASHELRTPLTAITGEVEVALMKDREKDEYKRVLHSVLDETRKLTFLSNGLLELVQSGAEDKMVTSEPIDVKSLVKGTIKEIEKRSAGCQVCIRTKFQEPNVEEGLKVSGSQPLLQAALLNVLENACKFSDYKPVFITSERISEDKIRITIEDQGIGMSEGDIKNAFQPFYRSENVQSIPGYGIGMSLTDKIVRLHKGEIKIDSSPGNGTKVEMIFPG
ncbi:HAMP domain-containing sensor histidine kinase [Cytophagaceae bacterium ABcell3]|nr:HAMP domain-containing sensor histidine kinase [Cytophagaceae bacterium ABcell3]